MVHSVLCVWNLGCWWIACFTPVLSALHHSWHHHSRSPLCILFLHQTFGCLLQFSWMKPSRGPCLSIRISDVLSMPLNISWVLAPQHVSPHTWIHQVYVRRAPGGYNGHDHNSGSRLCECWLSTKHLERSEVCRVSLPVPPERVTEPLTQWAENIVREKMVDFSLIIMAVEDMSTYQMGKLGWFLVAVK